MAFFRAQRPKQFNFMPRYYDEQKEKAQERQRRIEAELGIHGDGTTYKPTIRKGMISDKIKERRQIKRYSTLRLLVILAFLIILTLYLLSGSFTLSFLPK